MTGPNLRATGVPFDIRRAHPYSVFPELEFDIPTRSEGDCLARYLLRMDEIKQSLRIIDQCLHHMPDGPVMAKLPRLMRPRPGRAYGAVEGPRGQYSTYAISDGTDQPFRMRIHDPSFIHLQSRRPDDAGPSRSPTRWRSWRHSTRSWAASTSERVANGAPSDEPMRALPARAAFVHAPWGALARVLTRRLRLGSSDGARGKTMMTVVGKTWSRLISAREDRLHGRPVAARHGARRAVGDPAARPDHPRHPDREPAASSGSWSR